ncbi:MAG: hypothetical protein ACR2MG_12020 [Pyrinomonadaceae bacterium]
MATQILEGTWEEITKHAKSLAGRKVRVTILDDEPNAKPKPNEGMLEALRKIKERQKNMRETAGESSVDIIRRARSGEMFGYESNESDEQ